MATELELALQQISNTAGLTQAEKTEIKQGLKELANADGSLGANDRIWLREAIAAATAPAPTTNSGYDTWEPPTREPWYGPVDGDGNITPITKPPTEGGTTGPTSPMPTETPVGYMWVWDEATKQWRLVKDPNYKPPEEEKPGFSALDREGAEKRLSDLLTRYGLEALIPVVKDLIAKWGGNNDQVIISYLRDNPIYKERFKGNEYRINNKLGAMDEATYIATESAIRQKMRDFGLDGGFYTNEKIAGLIGYDVSADEVSDRLTKAKKIVDNADTNIKTSLVNLYGASLGDLIGYVLDPKLASEGLTRKINAGIAYGVAKGQDITLGVGLSEQIGELTYGDERTARQQMQQAGDMNRSTQRLKYIDGETDITDIDVVESQFGLDATSTERIRKMQSSERARFSGTSGIGRSTLSSGSGGRI